jgi:hypothetical protein
LSFVHDISLKLKGWSGGFAPERLNR